MSESIPFLDLAGLPCPQPVVRLRQALARGGFARLELRVDDPASRENVLRYAAFEGWTPLELREEPDGTRILLGPASPAALPDGALPGGTGLRGGAAEPPGGTGDPGPAGTGPGPGEAGAPDPAGFGLGPAGATVAVPAGANTGPVRAGATGLGGAPCPPTLLLAGEGLGRGDGELGALLMRGLLYTLAESDTPPLRVLLMNGGVRLAVEGAETLESLRRLEARGVEVLACGTCLEFLGLRDRLAVGRVTNLFEIAAFLMKESSIVL
jgi:TusA-related sulfurtransferase